MQTTGCNRVATARPARQLRHKHSAGSYTLYGARGVTPRIRCASAPIVRPAVTDYEAEVAVRKAEARAWINAWKAKQLDNQISVPATNGVAKAVAPEENAVLAFGHLGITMGLLYAVDQALKTAFITAGIRFPSALVGMAGVFVLLCVIGDKPAAALSRFFSPALTWITRWLPLFYVASLVTLPLALNGIPSTDLLKILGILSGGMVGTLLFTGFTAVWIRNIVKTPMKEVAKAKPTAPFTTAHFIGWGTVGAVSLLLTAVAPQQYGFQMALPFGLAATIGGYLLGSLVPKHLHGYLHPVVVTALVANFGAWAHGQLMGWDYAHALKVYFAKGTGPMGAGDVLMNLLGVVIISFGFRIYEQRETMKRHAPEILGATLLSSLFSMFSTAFAAKAIGLSSDLARAIIPRSVTVALALPIATQLDAPLAITAAAVLLQGLLGANFGPDLMTKFGIKDTIARGLSAAATAGGLGTASLTSKEPEALPFCALSYSMVGVLSTLLAAIPFIRQALVAIVGAA